MLFLFLFVFALADLQQEEYDIFGENVLSIAAFNVQIFGQNKVSQPDVLDVLAQCFRRWDLALIQEIRDASGTAIYQLLDAINNWPGPKYSLQVSEPLGRTNSKESYGFFYRQDVVSVLDNYTYNDIGDVFEREPHPVLFEKKGGNQKRFFIVSLHSKPTDTVAEINKLKDVFIDAKTRFGVDSGIIMGDINSDCSYLSQKDWANIPLKTDPDFEWLIKDGVDTTVAASSCTYDRFILSSDLVEFVEENSVGVFQFQTEFGLSSELTSRVSDHYPIEFGLNLGGNDAFPEPEQDPEPTNSTGGGGLSGGSIAAIVVCIVVVLPLILLTIFLLFNHFGDSGSAHEKF